MHSLLQDIRYGWRVLAKTPTFSLAVIVTLALGIGANTAIFAVIDAVLLRPLDIARPDRVVVLQESWRDVRGGGVSVGNFADISEQNQVFQSFAATASAAFNLATEDVPERVEGDNVSRDFFETLGIQPLSGRWFTAAENVPGGARVAILSERLWRTRFHADPALVGQTIRVNAVPVTVVGIMPKQFDPLLRSSDIWMPAAFTPAQLRNRDEHYLICLARLKPGVSLTQAQAELNVIASRQQQRYPLDDKESGFYIEPITDALLGDHRATLYTLLAAVGFVLLIACANVANLQLARARGRQKEIAMRVALGATPRRILRQLVAENVLVSAVSGVIGVLIAYWGIATLVANAPSGVPRLDQARIDPAVLGFACAIALLSGLLFGLTPAMRSASVQLVETIKEGVGTSTGGRDRVRSALVVAELSLALMLLVGAGLLIRSALAIAKVDPGFDTSHLVVGRIGLGEAQYSNPVVARATFENIVSATTAMPGVDSAAVVSRAPLGGGSSNGLLAEGKRFDPSDLIDAAMRVVTPGYVATARVPLKKGRDFSPQDTRDKTLVVLINETLARTMWPGQDPIGKRFACCEAGPKGRLDPVWHEVIGVVGDVRAWGLDQQVRPEFYMPLAQMPPRAWDWVGRTMDIVVRSRGSFSLPDLRATVARIAPGVPVYGLSTMQQKISSTLEQSHFDTFLLCVFAATALLLASIGVYGVLAYIVAQHTRDIGIRMALGATQARIIADVLRQGMRLTLIGVGIGVAGALVASRLMATLLYGVSATDAITFCAVPVVLLGVALLASYLASRRATQVDPMIALRYE